MLSLKDKLLDSQMVGPPPWKQPTAKSALNPFSKASYMTHDDNSAFAEILSKSTSNANQVEFEAQSSSTSRPSNDTTSHSHTRSPHASPERVSRSLHRDTTTTTIARAASRSTPPPRTWAEKQQHFVVRNKGVGLMILAQFFGAAMATVARLLETDEENGAPMHPFQVFHGWREVLMVGNGGL